MKKFLVLAIFTTAILHIKAQSTSSALNKDKGTVLIQAGNPVSRYQQYLDPVSKESLPDYIEKSDNFDYYMMKSSVAFTDKLLGYPVIKIYCAVMLDKISNLYVIIHKDNSEKLKDAMLKKYGEPEYITDPFGEIAPRYFWSSTDFKTNLTYYFGPNFETGEGEGAYMALFMVPGP